MTNELILNPMIATPTKPQSFQLTDDQRLDLICALADNTELIQGLLEEYIDQLDAADLEEVYGFYF